MPLKQQLISNQFHTSNKQNMETVTASGTAELSALDQQIAELQAKRHQQQKAAEKQAKVSQHEQLAEKIKANNSAKIERTRQRWPNGAVVLENLLAKQLELHELTPKAKVLGDQLSKRRSELKEQGRQLFGKELQAFGDLEQRAEDAHKRKAELERAIQADTTLTKAFAADHSKQLQSVLKTLEKAATELEDLAKVEHALSYHPKYSFTPKPKLPGLLKQLHEVMDSIENY